MTETCFVYFWRTWGRAWTCRKCPLCLAQLCDEEGRRGQKRAAEGAVAVVRTVLVSGLKCAVQIYSKCTANAQQYCANTMKVQRYTVHCDKHRSVTMEQCSTAITPRYPLAIPSLSPRYPLATHSLSPRYPLFAAVYLVAPLTDRRMPPRHPRRHGAPWRTNDAASATKMQ